MTLLEKIALQIIYTVVLVALYHLVSFELAVIIGLVWVLVAVEDLASKVRN